jgi:hypothetical protein
MPRVGPGDPVAEVAFHPGQVEASARTNGARRRRRPFQLV